MDESVTCGVCEWEGYPEDGCPHLLPPSPGESKGVL